MSINKRKIYKKLKNRRKKQRRRGPACQEGRPLPRGRGAKEKPPRRRRDGMVSGTSPGLGKPGRPALGAYGRGSRVPSYQPETPFFLIQAPREVARTRLSTSPGSTAGR